MVGAKSQSRGSQPARNFPPGDIWTSLVGVDEARGRGCGGKEEGERVE